MPNTLSPRDVLATERLHTRLPRTSDLRAELDAFRELSVLASQDAEQAIRRFLELAIELCPTAGSSGLSELMNDGEGGPTFRWTALAGEFAPYAGGTTPRHFSPCGLCLDEARTILVDRPGRVFTYFNEAHVPIIEGLIVPLHDGDGSPIGTLWVTSHQSEVRGFDGTDARIMERLAAQLVLSIKIRSLNQRLAKLS